MLKQMLSLLLCVLLAIPSVAQADNKQLEKEAKLKQKVVEWGTNKTVGVKLNSGEKLTGRLAGIKDDLFTIQFVAQNASVTERDILYRDVDKISSQEGNKAGRIAGNTALYILAGLGIFAIGVLIIQARN